MNGGVTVLVVVLVCLLQHPGCEGQTKKKTVTTTKTTRTVKIKPHQQKAIKQSNEIRANHAVPRLALDGTLLKKANKCAEYYANLGKVDDSCPHKGKSGENAWGQKGNWSKEEVVKMATDTWYDEGKNYDFTKNTPQAETADFTQLVWKKSDKMGFGVAQKNGFTTGVALFAPPGNVEGQFAENVKPAKNPPAPTTAPAAPAKTDPPPAEPAKTDAPPAEPAKTDPPPAEPPKTDAPASGDPEIGVGIGDNKVGVGKDGAGASGGGNSIGAGRQGKGGRH